MSIKHNPDLSALQIVLLFLAALFVAYGEPVLTHLRNKRARDASVKSD